MSKSERWQSAMLSLSVNFESGRFAANIWPLSMSVTYRLFHFPGREEW